MSIVHQKDKRSGITYVYDEAKAWYQDRNHRQKGVDWQFSIGDARIKLKSLYPVIEIKN